MKPVLFTAALGALLMSGPVLAKPVCETDDLGAAGSVRSCYDDDGDASPQPAARAPAPDQSRQRAVAKRLRAAEWSSDEAAEYAKRGDWDNTIRSLEEALDNDPDNEDLAQQMALAREAKAKATADKARAVATTTTAKPTTAKPVAKPPMSLDASVVDTRGVPQTGADLVARIPELAHSVAADRIRKGYQAVIAHDWPVALAWWQEALHRDPNNAALKRSVDLAQWMVARQPVKVANASPFAAAIDAATKGDNSRATVILLNLKATNPALTAQADILLAAIRNRVPTPRAEDSDIYAVMRAFYTNPMAGSALAVLASGDSKGADEIFAKIDETVSARGK